MEENIVSQGEAPAQPEVVETQVESQESPPAEDAQPQEEVPQKAPNPHQKRIDQLTWQRHDAERRLNAEMQRRIEVEERARQMEAQLAQLVQQATRPSLEQYNMDAQAYEKALQDHYEKANRMQNEMAERRREEERQAANAAAFQRSVDARVAEAKTKYADFDEVVNNPSLPPLAVVNPAVLASIIQHEQFADLTYYLGKNPAEAHRIVSLPPAMAILEVGKIAAKLGTQPASQSQAPKPPSTVSGTKANAGRRLNDTADLDEWMELRRKQLAGRR